MDISTHKKALGVFYIVFGIFNILFAILAFFLIWRIFDFAQVPPEVYQIVTIAGASFAGVLLLASLLSIIGGAAFMRFKSWAKMLLLILGVFYLFLFPVGTILGIYTLVVFLSDNKPERRTYDRA